MFFEAKALLSNMAANSNDQMEIRQETFLSSSQNTREKNPAFLIYSYIVRFNIKLWNYMLLSQILTSKFSARNVPFNVLGCHVTVKHLVTHRIIN